MGLEGIRHLDDLEVEGKYVFVRVDFNVPLDEKQRITDDERIVRALPTLKRLAERGSKLIVASHLGRPKGKVVPKLSMVPIGEKLSELLKFEVYVPDAPTGDASKKIINDLRSEQVCLLENLRYDPREKANDEDFARELAQSVDVYVNDAFGAAHRAHASVSALPRLMQERGVGLLLAKEIATLSNLIKAPERPFVAVLGGAKVADKLGVIESLIEKCSAICIGGAMANTLLAAQGHKLGKSKLEADWLAGGRTLMERAERQGVRILLPRDLRVATSLDAQQAEVVPVTGVAANQMALDIGPETEKAFRDAIFSAKTVFWNGPMGLFENPIFAQGSFSVAKSLSEAPGLTVVGGGDSASALRKAEKGALVPLVDFVSTGGGAALEMIEGKKLPGVEALRYSEG